MSTLAAAAVIHPGDPDGQAVVTRLGQWFEDNDAPAALVTVVETAGSAPRAPGARLVTRAGALLDGTIGGGHLEQAVIDKAASLLNGSQPFQPERVEWSLGPALAQCCGGRVSVVIEWLDAAAARALRDELARASGDTWTCAGDALRERVFTPWTVVIFGAGHVGRALARVVALQPWRCVVVDGRVQWAVQEAFPSAVDVRFLPPSTQLAQWGWLGHESPAGGPDPTRTCALVMTHDHALDQELVHALLAVQSEMGPLAYVGLIGSKTKIASTKRRLASIGVPSAAIDRLVAPVGLKSADGRPVGGKRPSEIALSVAAELLMVTGACA